MKKIRFLPLAIALCVITMSPQSFVKADMNAQAIVDQFNSASGGSKMQFVYGTNYEVNLKQYSSSGFADTSAYAPGVTGGSNYFRTFCVQPNVGVYTNMEATLNYVNGKSSTTSGHFLTLGAAYLYSQFATGTLQGYNYAETSARSTSSSNLLTAIRALMSITIVSNWSANPFLNQLLLSNSDRDYWTSAYDPNQYYDIIGNYSVFVMNNNEIGTNRDGQDFLYVVATNPSSDIPEPATLFLWGLGGLGVIGAARRRKKLQSTQK
ncbi:MAG: PEP-CTERM sorting domain-containing protein [Planctomycetaceae bacterium]|nr:PEP-CTERM sorting domain-containing protein [Planctomycetaceae bacterium]